MEGIVYKIVNNVNNKVYVGITTKGISGRYPGRSWKVSNTRSRLVKKAMTKHGSDNFEIFIIEKCKVEDLEKKEIFYINFFNSVAPHGYNLTFGGNYKKEVSDQTKNKISQSKKGAVAWNKGIVWSQERKLNHPKPMKGKPAWNRGKKMGPMKEETILRSAKAHCKPVNCFDLNGNFVKKYDSLKDTKVDGFNPAQVCLVCKGKALTHRGYKFNYVQ